MGALDDLIKSTTPSLDALAAPKKKKNSIADFRKADAEGYKDKPMSPIMAKINYGIGPKINRLGEMVADTLLFTDREKESGGRVKYTPIRDEATQKKIDIAGQLIGSVVPIGGAYATGGKMAANTLARFAPKAGNVTRHLIRGAGAGATYGAAEGITQGETPRDVAGSILTNAALFALGDAAFSAAVPIVKNTFSTPEGALKNLDLRNPATAFRVDNFTPRTTRSGVLFNETIPARDFSYIQPGAQDDVGALLRNVGQYPKQTPRPFDIIGQAAAPTTQEASEKQFLDAIEGLQGDINKSITPPLPKKKRTLALTGYIYHGLNGEVPLQEVKKLSYEQLLSLAKDIAQQRKSTLWDTAIAEAEKQGINLDDLYKTATDPEYARMKELVGLSDRALLNDAVASARQTGEDKAVMGMLDRLAAPKAPKMETPQPARSTRSGYLEAETLTPEQAQAINNGSEKNFVKHVLPKEAIRPAEVELNAARGILKMTQNTERAAKILDTYPELKKDFPSWIRRIETQAKKELSGPAKSEPVNSRSGELAAARVILRRTKNPDSAAKILDAFPELRNEFNGDMQPFKTQGPALQGMVNRLSNDFRNKVNREPRKRGTIAETLRKLQAQFVDDVTPLGRLEKSIRGGKLASAEDSLYKQARLFRGSPTKANEIVKTRLAPIVNEIEKKGFTSKDLGDYALAIHARDVNRQGITSGFSDAEIQAVISKYGTPEMEAARQKLVGLGNEMLNELADAQVISRELVKTLRQKYPNYMPLFRSFDDDKVEFAAGMSKRMANVANPIKKLKGSERDVVDPLESMVKNIFQATNAADRNRVALQLAKLADEDTTGQFIRRMAPGEEIGRKNAVYARINGEKQYFEVDPEVYKAVLQLDQEGSNFLIRMLQKPASVLRAGATLTPEFSLRNPMRDFVHAYAVSNSGLKPHVDIPAAIIDILRPNSKLLPQFLADNAGFGNIVSMDRQVHREALKKVLREPPSKKFVNLVTGRSLINLLRTIADISETTTKLAEYRAALRSGVSRPEAAYRARDIMDFARAGTSIREANKIIAFLNANIQGKSKLLRAIRENPVGVTTRAIKLVTLPSVASFLAQKYLANDGQLRTIDEAPPWLKDAFWLIPIPGTDQIARLPKPFDLAPLFANLPERTLDYVFNQDPKAFDRYAYETFSTLSVPVMITGLLPFIEGMANYSFFRQAPIIPQREERIRQVDQFDVNTTETAKMIARATHGLTGGEGPFKNLGSPRVIDHIITGLTAGLGRYATSSIDAMLQAGGALEKPPRPAKKISEQPLIKAFLVNENLPSNAIENLYDERDKLRRAKGSAEGRKEPFREVGKLKYIESITGTIGDISKTMRQIENDPKMSPQAKRHRLDVLRKKRDDIARKAVKRLGI